MSPNIEDKDATSRIIDNGSANAHQGHVSLSMTKLFWVGGMALVAIIGGIITFSYDAVALFCTFTAISLCFGHSLGMHRRLIHKSYQCPQWFEYLMVHLGVIVGLAGPFGMIKTHDLRDWAQRQPQCHHFLGHQQQPIKDIYWQLLCNIHLDSPPKIQIEDKVQQDPIYIWIERYWMCQQLPWALLFFALGGIPWVVWGICMRVVVSILGHWMIGYFAHNYGHRNWHINNASIQGHNVKFASLLTMGESWHNNHHAFPGSAKLGLESGQWDPGWWVLTVMEKLGIVWDIVLPIHLPNRPELVTTQTVIGCESSKIHKPKMP